MDCPYCKNDIDDRVIYQTHWESGNYFEMECPECGKIIDVQADFIPTYYGCKQKEKVKE
jgi:acetone carboxylase gamma subunit